MDTLERIFGKTSEKQLLDDFQMLDTDEDNIVSKKEANEVAQLNHIWYGDGLCEQFGGVNCDD